MMRVQVTKYVFVFRMFHLSFEVTQFHTADQHCLKSVSILSYSGLYFPAFWTEYGEIQSIFPYSVRIRENTDQNNSEYGHFSHSAIDQSSEFQSTALFINFVFISQIYSMLQNLINLTNSKISFLNLAKSGHLKIPRISYFVLK